MPRQKQQLRSSYITSEGERHRGPERALPPGPRVEGPGGWAGHPVGPLRSAPRSGETPAIKQIGE